MRASSSTRSAREARALQAIEIMACPGGCVGGGGQPYHHGHMEIVRKRAEALYREDLGKPRRKSHENPDIIRLYEEFLGKPLGEKSTISCTRTISNVTESDRQNAECRPLRSRLSARLERGRQDIIENTEKTGRMRAKANAGIYQTRHCSLREETSVMTEMEKTQQSVSADVERSIRLRALPVRLKGCFFLSSSSVLVDRKCPGTLERLPPPLSRLRGKNRGQLIRNG
jgi:hypothetical protein